MLTSLIHIEEALWPPEHVSKVPILGRYGLIIFNKYATGVKEGPIW